MSRTTILSWNMQAAMGTRKLSDYASKFHENLFPAQKESRLLSVVANLKDFDLIGLQECDQGSWRSGGINQGEFLANKAGFTQAVFHTSRKVSNVSGSGLSLLSKHPIIWSQGHVLPSRFPGRGALEAKVKTPTGVICVLVVHFSLGKKDQLLQMKWVQEWTKSLSGPYVVMGDFNTSPDWIHFKNFVSSIENLNIFPESFPSWKPKRSIDHMLVNGLDATITKTFDPGISDHLGLMRQVWLPSAA